MKLISELLAGLMIIFFDRITKQWALSLGTGLVAVFSFVRFEYALNTGISWSLFADNVRFMNFVVIPLIVVLLLMVFRQAYQRICAGLPVFAESLVVAGAISNVWDRIFYGGVIDFITVYYHEWFFPSFNIADMAITVGVFLMLIREVRDISW